MKIFITTFLLCLLSGPAYAQEIVEIVVGSEASSRALPTTLEDANNLVLGLAAVLNNVIAAYEADSASASGKVVAILAQQDLAKETVDKIDQAIKTPFLGPSLPKVFRFSLVAQSSPDGSGFSFGPELGLTFGQLDLQLLLSTAVFSNQVYPLIGFGLGWYF